MNCGTCKFWFKDGQRSGDCRRYPPTAGVRLEGNAHDGYSSSWDTAWPYVDKNGGCGEWSGCKDLNLGPSGSGPEALPD